MSAENISNPALYKKVHGAETPREASDSRTKITLIQNDKFVVEME